MHAALLAASRLSPREEGTGKLVTAGRVPVPGGDPAQDGRQTQALLQAPAWGLDGGGAELGGARVPLALPAFPPCDHPVRAV